MVLVLASQKGGAGKSTLTISLAVEGLRRGLRVVAVDADPQRTLSVWHGVATEAGHVTPDILVLGQDMHRRIPSLAQDADLVLIDTPPRHEAIVRSALVSADVVLLPSNGSAADVWSVGSTAKLISEARKVSKSLDARIVLNRLQSRTAVGKSARATLEATSLPVCRSEVHDRIAFQEAIAAGLGPSTYAPSSLAADEVRALFEETCNVKASTSRRTKRS